MCGGIRMKVGRIDWYAQAAFIIFVFVFCVAWTVVQPFNSAPDEYMRYQIPQFIFNYGSLPHGGDPAIRNPFWGTSYGFTPILSYMIAALFMKVTSLFTTDAFSILVSARMVSVLCITGTVWFGFRIAQRLFKGMERWAFVVFFSMIPQFIFLSSYVNVDAIAMLSTAVIIYAWVLGLQTDWNLKSCIVLAVGVALCALSYYNAYGFILCSVLLFVFSILLTSEKPWEQLIKKGLLITGIVLVLAGWWFVRNYIIYNGDILGMHTCDEYQEMYAKDKLKPSNLQTLQERGIPVLYMLIKMHWIKTVFTSFIGMFGYLNVSIYKWIYKVFICIFTVGFAGFLTRLRILFPLKKEKEKRKALLFNITMLIAMAIPNLVNIYYSYASDFQPQGRYSMPMLLPLAYFVVIGICSLLKWAVRNALAQKVLLGVFCMGCISLSLICYFNILLPRYLPH